MSKSLADSEKLYEEIKKFFYEKDEYDFVIEISDRPMSEWKLIYVLSPDEMSNERHRIRTSGGAFAGFMNHERQYYFYFLDMALFKKQNVKTGEIIDYDDRTFSEIDMKKVADELRQLMARKAG